MASNQSRFSLTLNDRQSCLFRKFHKSKIPANLLLSYYVKILNQPIVGFLYHEFVGSKSFDVHAYFQDLFIGGKFYQFFPIDAAFYD